MKASEILINKLKEFEGLRLTAYKCPAGVWTIGYGHTEGVTAGMKINEAAATAFLRQDLRKYEADVERLGLNLTQGEADALIDFCYNLGSGRLRTSTLLKKIKVGNRDKESITKEFMRWNTAVVGGKRKVLAGLTKRRAWEAQRFFE